MVKASALYLVVIVALLIAILSASLLSVSFFYRQEVKKKERFDKLLLNLRSGTSIVLSDGFLKNAASKHIDLFGRLTDSVIVQKDSWGVFNLGLVHAFELRDTLKRSFLIGNKFDDTNAIYLVDEDRPLSVSGNTRITGDGQLPKSGLRQSYVDGKPYTGKELIKGKITNSNLQLPPLNSALLKSIEEQFKYTEGMQFDSRDSIGNSFFSATQIFNLAQDQLNLSSGKLEGRIVLISDTTLTISAGMKLNNIQIYAPAIVVNEGFKGSCQLFAQDSIVIGKNCVFEYPSFAGVFKTAASKVQAKISLNDGVRFSGILLSYESKRTDLQTMISIGKNCIINGEVFATGYIKLNSGLKVNGKVTAKRFLMQTVSTIYENYLIDFTLNRKLLSQYYLSAPIFKANQVDQKVLKWLN